MSLGIGIGVSAVLAASTGPVVPVVPQPTYSANFMSQAIPAGATSTRTGPSTFYNSSGIVTSAANNTPRFDYNPATKTLNGLLLEEARTNLAPNSVIGSTTYALNSASATYGAAGAPDGSASWARLTANAAGGGVYTQNSVAISGSTTYTLSAYFSLVSGGPNLRLIVGQGAFGESGGDRAVIFNGSTGAFVSKATEISTYTIQSTGSGVYRVSATFTSTAGSNATFLALYADTSGTVFNVWGVQLEAGAFSSSYIPTAGGSATRGADMCFHSGVNFYNNAGSTIYAEFILNAANAARLSHAANLNDGGQTNTLNAFFGTSAPVFNTGGSAGGTSVPSAMVGSSLLANTLYRLGAAFAAQSGGSQIAVGGTLGTASSPTALPATINRIDFGNRPDGTRNMNGWLRRVDYYNSRLSDANLQSLTSTGSVV